MLQNNIVTCISKQKCIRHRETNKKYIERELSEVSDKSPTIIFQEQFYITDLKQLEADKLE